ncbi:ribbon-helix-helix protein, CopG family [Microbispora sp. ATCC PTA-5024]|uniref:ribbon-helix-helix protein, CopG family n=1 Tax=Microbispora sp. ATCC PTA-5024 TaxID=316330 RepID=UPI0012EE7BFE|nr:ribbon-helix-helix protein, CopG family [Microbispora sp. ATCC PTA-5024]
MGSSPTGPTRIRKGENGIDNSGKRTSLAKLNLMLGADDLAFLERFVAAEGAKSRAAAIRRAIALLRAQTEPE